MHKIPGSTATGTTMYDIPYRSTMSAHANAFTPATQTSHVGVPAHLTHPASAAVNHTTMQAVDYSGTGMIGLGGNNPKMMPVNSFVANADTVVHFDRQEELIWLASSQGQISSMYPIQDGTYYEDANGQNVPNLYFERYTAINLANTLAGCQSRHIHALQTASANIVFSTTKAVSCRAKTGLHKWTYQDEKLTANLNAMCVSNSSLEESMRYNPYSRHASQSCCYFGGQQEHLVQLDVPSGKVRTTRSVANGVYLLKMSSDNNLFAADNLGNISLYDTRTMNKTQTFNAHTGGILDFDFASEHRIVSCGLSQQYAAMGMGGAYPRFIQIYDLRTSGAGYQPAAPMQIPYQSNFVRYFPPTGEVDYDGTPSRECYMFLAEDGYTWMCPDLTPGGRPRVHDVTNFHLGSQDGLDAVSSVDVSTNGKYAAVLMKSGACHYIANPDKPAYYEQFNNYSRQSVLPDPIPQQPFRPVDPLQPFEPLCLERTEHIPHGLHDNFPEAPLPKKKDLTNILKNLQKTKLGDLDIHFGRIPTRHMQPNQAPYEFRNEAAERAREALRVEAMRKRQSNIPDKYNFKKILARDLSRKIRPFSNYKFYHSILHCLYHCEEKLRHSLMSFLNFGKESSVASELGQLFYQMQAPVTPTLGQKPICPKQFDTLFHLQQDANALRLTEAGESANDRNLLAEKIQCFIRYLFTTVDKELRSDSWRIEPETSHSGSGRPSMHTSTESDTQSDDPKAQQPPHQVQLSTFRKLFTSRIRETQSPLDQPDNAVSKEIEKLNVYTLNWSDLKMSRLKSKDSSEQTSSVSEGDEAYTTFSRRGRSNNDFASILRRSIFLDKTLKKGSGKSQVSWRVQEEPITFPEILVLNTNIQQLDEHKKVAFAGEVSLDEHHTYELISVVWCLQDIDKATTIAHIRIEQGASQSWYLFNNGKITMEDDPRDIYDRQYSWRRPATLFYKKVFTLQDALLRSNEKVTLYNSLPGSLSHGLYRASSVLATESEVELNIKYLLHWFRQINNTGGMFSPVFDMFFRYVISSMNHLLQSSRAKIPDFANNCAQHHVDGLHSSGGGSSGSNKFLGVMGLLQTIDSSQTPKLRGNLTKLYTDPETGMTKILKRKSSREEAAEKGPIPIFTPPKKLEDDPEEIENEKETQCLFRLTVSNDIEVILDHFIVNRACEGVTDDRDLGDGIMDDSVKDSERTKYILKTRKHMKEYDMSLLKYMIDLISGRSCIVYQTLKKLQINDINFVGNIILQCIKYSMSPTKIIAGFFHEPIPSPEETDSADTTEQEQPQNQRNPQHPIHYPSNGRQPQNQPTSSSRNSVKQNNGLKNYNCLFLGKRQTYAQLRYLLEQGYTFVGDEQVHKIFKCARVPYSGHERQIINVVKLFSDQNSDQCLTFDFLAWYYLWRNDDANHHQSNNTAEFRRYLRDTLIRSKVALKLYNKYHELIGKHGKMQFRLHDLRELVQVGVQMGWKIP